MSKVMKRIWLFLKHKYRFTRIIFHHMGRPKEDSPHKADGPRYECDRCCCFGYWEHHGDGKQIQPRIEERFSRTTGEPEARHRLRTQNGNSGQSRPSQPTSMSRSRSAMSCSRKAWGSLSGMSMMAPDLVSGGRMPPKRRKRWSRSNLRMILPSGYVMCLKSMRRSYEGLFFCFDLFGSQSKRPCA